MRRAAARILLRRPAPGLELRVDFTDNGLVSTLSTSDQAFLYAGCRATALNAQDVLATPSSAGEHIYLLTGASVAQLVRSGKRSVAVGLVGFAGAVGLHYALDTGPSGFTMLVQGRGNAWTIEGDALRSMVVARPAMLLAISRYLWADAQALASYAANLQSQTVTQRLACWIVSSRGSDGDATLELTHVHLARMLGVRRASISLAALELRARGLLDYSRGHIVVRDLAGLRDLAGGHR
jgi:CRP-like cAMP-binding protein